MKKAVGVDEADEHKDGDRQCGEHRHRADGGGVLKIESGYVQPRPDGRHCREDEHVAVTPGERQLATLGQDFAGGKGEVHPPHPEGQCDASHGHPDHLPRPTLRVDDRGQSGNGADDLFTQGNDDQQPVAFGNVLRVPRCAAPSGFGEERPAQLDNEEHEGKQQGDCKRRVDEDEHDPAELGHRE